MKIQPVIFFSLIVNLFITVSFAQSGSGSQFFVAKKSHAYFVEIKTDTAYVFSAPVMTSNQVYFGKRVNAIDTLFSGTGEFVGNKFNLITLDAVLYLTSNGSDKHQPKKLELERVEDPQTLNEDLNESYWFTNYIKMIREIDTIYPYANFSMETGWYNWRGFTNKNSYYEDFRAFVDGYIPSYKDSILQAHAAYTKILEGMQSNMMDLTADESIKEIQQFPNSKKQYSGYAKAIVNEIAEIRPELFYEIAEKSGDQQQQLFSSVSKPAIKTLKKIETDSPSKKQFKKFRRKQTFIAVGGVSVLVLGNAAFYGTIGYFIFR